MPRNKKHLMTQLALATTVIVSAPLTVQAGNDLQQPVQSRIKPTQARGKPFAARAKPVDARGKPAEVRTLNNGKRLTP